MLGQVYFLLVISLDLIKPNIFLRKTSDIIVVKFIVLPLIAYFVVIYLFNDPILIGSMIIAFSAPTAINAVLACSIYKLKYKYCHSLHFYLQQSYSY